MRPRVTFFTLNHHSSCHLFTTGYFSGSYHGLIPTELLGTPSKTLVFTQRPVGGRQAGQFHHHRVVKRHPTEPVARHSGRSRTCIQLHATVPRSQGPVLDAGSTVQTGRSHRERYTEGSTFFQHVHSYGHA